MSDVTDEQPRHVRASNDPQVGDVIIEGSRGSNQRNSYPRTLTAVHPTYVEYVRKDGRPGRIERGNLIRYIRIGREGDGGDH